MVLSSTDNHDIRKFGAVGLCFFGILFAIGLWRYKTIVTYIFGFFSFLGLCFLVIPSPFRPVYKNWLKLAHFIGVMMTSVILTVAYYIIVTPTALVKRMLGGRPLPTAPNKNATTYWVSRPEPAQPKKRFVKRY
jgi:hypothetical protein